MAATTALTASSAGFDLLGGIFGKNAADAKAKSLRDQARLLEAESNAEVARYSEQAASFKATQKLAYLKSGVSLSGSPLDILDETVRVSQENINAMRARTAAQAAALRGKGGIMKAEGRAALLKGFSNAAVGTLKSGYKLGWFSKSPKTPELKTEFKNNEFGSVPGLDEYGSKV